MQYAMVPCANLTKWWASKQRGKKYNKVGQLALRWSLRLGVGTGRVIAAAQPAGLVDVALAARGDDDGRGRVLGGEGGEGVEELGGAGVGLTREDEMLVVAFRAVGRAAGPCGLRRPYPCCCCCC
jgi:hypothetical protein